MDQSYPKTRENLAETRQELIARWSIVPISDTPEDLNWELLLDALQERILHLLARNPERLLAALYLLDISETRYHAAMSGPDLTSNARALAQVVLDRETAKIAMRKLYTPETGPARLESSDADRPV